ncbi:MAG: c-type cytochrome [Desulfitobacteriaceae bacterium]
MQFSIYQIPYLGNGMTIALDAVLHVLISHGIAIGTISLIVLSEYLGWKYSSQAWDEFARRLLRLSVILTTSVGAVTGVGIWFITSVLEPRGIASLLRVFFWPWFIEWLVFTAELITLLFYYRTWKSWTGPKKRAHLRLGFLYILLAWASGALITGILGFMLTPDGWPITGNFWGAFFNPTFLPQLLLRLSAALVLGSLFSLTYLVFTQQTADFRKKALHIFGWTALLALLSTTLCTFWYFRAVPPNFKTHAIFSVLGSTLSQQPRLFWLINSAGAIFLLLLAFLSIRNFPRLTAALIIPALIFGMAFVGEFERVREFIRGPYVMPGYIYANQILMTELPDLNSQGLLSQSYWFNVSGAQPAPTQEGAYLFGQNCSVCHTIGGINNIVDRVKGRSEDGLYVIIGHTHEMVPFMAPFAGSDKERHILANYLYNLAAGVNNPQGLSRFIPLRKER